MRDHAPELFFALEGLPPPRTRPVGVAVSGGADSLALFEALVRLWGPDGLEVVHVDHGLRPESAAEGRLVRERARVHGVPFITRRLRMRAGPGLEERARSRRYRCFRETAWRRGWERLLLAHHRDDQRETVAMRILRGAGVQGLRGIPAQRLLFPGCRIERPLLSLAPQRLREFLRQSGVVWAEDPSNRDPAPLRNRLRLRILPELSPRRLDQRLDAVARTAAELSAHLKAEVDALLDGILIHRSAAAFVIRADPLASLGPALRDALLTRLMRELGVPSRSRSTRLRVQRLALESGDHPPIQLAPGFLAWRSQGLLHGFTACRLERALLATPRELPLGGRLLHAFEDAPEVALRTDPRTRVWIARKAIRGSLQVAGMRDGERYRPLGAPGRRKLSDLAAEAGIPSRWRSAWPVVRDDAGPLWLPGAPPAERARLTGAGAPAVALELEGGPPLPEK